MLIVEGKRINLLHIFIIFGVGLIATIPAILYGVFEAHDLIPFHLKWSKYFSEQFWQGDLYPRWLLNMNSGLGSPTFFFYAPIPYYFTSLFHPLFANDIRGWNQLSLSALLATVASGITAYIWLKNITNQNSALIGSVLYMVLPYHLATDLYLRFAFGEYWAFVWLPLILFFTKKIISSSKIINILGLAVSYALLIMTHLFTVVMFSLIPISYILLMATSQERKKALTRLIGAMMLGIGLSAIYWLPAIFTQKYVSMSEIMTNYYFYANNFLFMSFREICKYLQVLSPLMAGLAYYAFSIARTNPIINFRRESYYWIIVAMVTLLMMLPVSLPLWYILSPLQRIQFTWRFNTILTLATTALLTLVIPSLEQRVNFSKKTILTIGILLVTSLVLAGLQVLPILYYIAKGKAVDVAIIAITVLLLFKISSLKEPVNFSNKKSAVIVILLTTSLVLSNGLIIQKSLYLNTDVGTVLGISMDAKEYRPKWVEKDIFEPNTLSQLGKSSTKAQVTAGQGSLSIQRWKPREIVLQASAITDIWLTLNQFYYPGWTAKLEGESRFLDVQPSTPEGLLRVSVPRGKHQVIVKLNALVEERAGQIISAISTIIIALFLMFWPR